MTLNFLKNALKEMLSLEPEPCKTPKPQALPHFLFPPGGNLSFQEEQSTQTDAHKPALEEESKQPLLVSYTPLPLDLKQRCRTVLAKQRETKLHALKLQQTKAKHQGKYPNP